MDLTARLYISNSIFALCIFSMYWAVHRPNLQKVITKWLEWSALAIFIAGPISVYYFRHFADPSGFFTSSGIAGLLYIAGQTISKISKDRAQAA